MEKYHLRPTCMGGTAAWQATRIAAITATDRCIFLKTRWRHCCEELSIDLEDPAVLYVTRDPNMKIVPLEHESSLRTTRFSFLS